MKIEIETKWKQLICFRKLFYSDDTSNVEIDVDYDSKLGTKVEVRKIYRIKRGDISPLFDWFYNLENK